MKTAITQLIEELQNGFLEDRYNNSSDILLLCVKYQETEKQQIIEAANHGANFETSPYSSAHEYYEQTFNNQ